MKVAISFLGGVVGDLTKSSILISINRSGYETSILVDCGLWQGSKSRFYERNMELDVDPTTLDAVLITHAHVDHLGRLPVLYNNGLGHDGKEKVSCTKPTFSLAKIMLLDTANIAERESLRRIHKEEEINRKTVRDIRKTFKNNGRKEVLDKFNIGWAIKPYSIFEAEESMKLFKGNGCPYEEWFKVSRKVEAKFYPSGHVLGGA